MIHGDPHLGNLFDDHGRTGFLDWGIVNVSSPMRDVSYFITMAMGIEDRRAHEEELLRHYLDVHNSLASVPIAFDDAWRMHREQAAYTVPACCQIVVFPDNITEKRRVFSQAFLGAARPRSRTWTRWAPSAPRGSEEGGEIRSSSRNGCLSFRVAKTRTQSRRPVMPFGSERFLGMSHDEVVASMGVPHLARAALWWLVRDRAARDSGGSGRVAE